MVKKITIAGAGRVGATAAHLAAIKELGNIVIWNRTESTAKGIALDISESMSIEESDVDVIGTSDFSQTKNSDVVAITMGAQRKEGQSRDELLFINADMIKGVMEQLVKYSPKAIFIIVTNPVDVMIYLAYKISKLPKNKMIGMAGILDSARFRNFIGKRLNVSVDDVSALVLGGHGDFMVPLPNHVDINGVPLTQMLPKSEIDQMVERTRNGGAEIISLMKDSSAFYAPAASLVQMIESIVKDKKRVLPCAAYLDGEYGLKDVFVGVPVKIGDDGVESVIELKLTDEEMDNLKKSAGKIKESITLLKNKKYF
ncbi:MAG TPA: malate dehydrogenase [archaeon]|nr:malate dehydrogenase [archaeon]